MKISILLLFNLYLIIFLWLIVNVYKNFSKNILLNLLWFLKILIILLIRKLLIELLKRYPGIYLIVNLANGKYYVGSAVTGNLYMRLHKHLFAFIGNVHVANAV